MSTSPSAREAFSTWVPSPKERNDMIEVAAYHMAQRSGFKSNPQDCWDAGEAQVDLMLSLRESQNKLQTIVDNALDAVVMIDSEGVITGWNPQATRIFGWTPAEALGRSIDTMIIPLRYREAHLRGMNHFLSGGDGPFLKTLVEIRSQHRDGHEFPVELTIAPVRTEGKLEFSAFIRDITERKRAEDSLRESGHRLRTMVDYTYDWEYWQGPHDEIIYMSPSCERVTGYTQEEFAKAPDLVDRIVHPDDRALWNAHRQQISVQEVCSLDFRIVRRDGNVLWIAHSCQAVYGQDGPTAGRRVSNRDITERKRIEGIQAARVRLMAYATGQSLKDLLVATLDEASLLTESTIGFYHFLEPDQKTLSLQAWSTRTTQEFCSAAGEGNHYSVDEAGVWVECIHLGRPVIHNDYASLPNKRGLPPGHARVLREMVVPVFRKGMIVAILGVGNKATPYAEADLDTITKLADLAWDFAENMRASEALRESEERWKFALEGAGDGVWDWNVQSGEVKYSKRWKEMLGYAENDIGTDLSEWKRLIHPDDAAGALASVAAYLSGATPDYFIEHRLHCRDGSWKWILSRGMIVSRTADGKPLRLIGTHTDISERIAQQDRLEQQVRERTAQLRAMAIELTMAEERERHIVAQDLHDGLGQTLAVAKLKLSALDFPGQDSAADSKLKSEVKKIEALLDEANQAMRTLSLQLSPPILLELGLVPALEWLADEMQRVYKLRVGVSDDSKNKPLGEIELKAVFRATRELLINVAKHAQVLEAEVEARCEAEQLIISVADAGAGFDLSRACTPTASSGYGLLSVRERIDFLGGNVQIDSSPGNGTVVIMSVPLTTGTMG